AKRFSDDGPLSRAFEKRDKSSPNELDDLPQAEVTVSPRRGRVARAGAQEGRPMTDVSFDVEITRVARQPGTRGVWVTGRLAGHRFEALVFEQRAQRPEWELQASCISKLWLRREADKRIVFNWDRGPDVPPADATVTEIVDFLAAGLADHVFSR